MARTLQAPSGENTVVLGPWPKGVNNRQPDHSLPPDTVRNAVNVDIDNLGRMRSRAGLAKVYNKPGCHSAFTCPLGTFFVEGTALKKLAVPGYTATTLRTGITDTVSYEYFNGEVYYSDGVITGKLNSSSVAVPWGLPAPAAPIVTVGAGSLPAGKYLAFVTFSDGSEEGGASEVVQVDVSTNGRVTVQTPNGAATWANVFVSTANGGIGYYVGRTAPGGSVSVTTLPGSGRPLKPDFYIPPPAGNIVRFYRGRMFIVSGSTVYYTQPHQLGRAHNKNYFPMPATITVFEPVTNGIWCVADQTYFLRGEDPTKFTAEPQLNYGAVAHTGLKIPNTNDVLWMSVRGTCRGDQDGNVVNLQEENVAVRPGASGAAYVRELNGLRQYVAAYQPSGASVFQNTTWATAEAVRKGF